MRRLAIFVEGYTELLFIDRLIGEIAEQRQIAIEHRKIRGGGKKSGIPTYVEILKKASDNGEPLYVLIMDCGGDHLVAQRVREEHPHLDRKGYESIIGLRDVFPNFSKADIPKLRMLMRTGIKTKLIPVHFFLAIMEIEAWFLAEHNHFPNIDPAISVASIQATLGFNPESEDMSERLNAATDLNAAYQIGGKSYVKGDGEGTVEKLDYDYIYLTLRKAIPDLDQLLSVVDGFMKPITVGVTAP